MYVKFFGIDSWTPETFSCSVELYKLWYTLADFLPNWVSSCLIKTFHYVCKILRNRFLDS
jgi:hypothetical protein